MSPFYLLYFAILSGFVFFAVAEHRSYRKRSIPAKGVKNWLRWHTLTLIFGALTTIPTTILTVAGTDKIAEWYPSWVGPHITTTP